MAINAQWVATGVNLTSSTNLYTVPSSTSATYAYARDLVINNSSPSTTMFAALSAAAGPAATTTASFNIPAGGSVILTQCQVPAGTIVSVIPTASGTVSASVGYALNVSYV